MATATRSRRPNRNAKAAKKAGKDQVVSLLALLERLRDQIDDLQGVPPASRCGVSLWHLLSLDTHVQAILAHLKSEVDPDVWDEARFEYDGDPFASLNYLGRRGLPIPPELYRRAREQMAPMGLAIPDGWRRPDWPEPAPA